MPTAHRACFVAVVALSLLGCGSDEGASPTSDQPSPYDPNALRYTSEEYVLEPGEEEYRCYTFALPEEGIGEITRIHPEYGEGVHHTFFSYALAPEMGTDFECPQLFKTTWIPLYLGGVGTDPLDMPEGTAVTVPTRQLVLQLHLQNTTASVVRDRTTMHVSVADPGTKLVPAGIFGLDNRKIELPPQSSDVKTAMECAPGRDMNVFGVLGHMHKLGSHLSVGRVGGETLYAADWSFDEQPITPASFDIAKDDRVSLSCTHSNPSSKIVSWGESSDTEMCAVIFYYSPFDQLGGCIDAP